MESIIFRKGFDKKRPLKLPVSESLNASILMKHGLHIPVYSDVNTETLFSIASRRQTVCGGGGVYGGDRRRPVSVYIVSAIPRTEVSSDPATTLRWTVSGGDNVTPHCTIMGIFLLLLFLLSHSSKVRGWQIYSIKYIKLAAAGKTHSNISNELVV